MSTKAKEIAFTLFVGLLLFFGFWYTLGSLVVMLVCGFDNGMQCSQATVNALGIIPAVLLSSGLVAWKLRKLK